MAIVPSSSLYVAQGEVLPSIIYFITVRFSLLCSPMCVFASRISCVMEGEEDIALELDVFNKLLFPGCRCVEVGEI